MRHTIQAPPFWPPQGFPGIPMMPTAPSGPVMPAGQGVFPGQGMPGMGMPAMGMPAMGMPGIGMPNMATPGFGGLGMPGAQGFPMALSGVPQGMPMPAAGWPTMTAPPGGPLAALAGLQGLQPGGAQVRSGQGWTTGREES